MPTTFPHPPGTAVLGKHPATGLFFRQSCRNHIFETISEAQPAEWSECGFSQMAKCLLCEYVTPAVDADWWSVLADAFTLAGFYGEIHAVEEGCERAKERAADLLVVDRKVAVMRDFG